MLNTASARDAVRSAWRVFILRCAVADPGEGLHPQLACQELPGRGGTGAPRVQCPSGTWTAQKQPGFTSSAQALLSDPLGGRTSATGKILPILKFLIEGGGGGLGCVG